MEPDVLRVLEFGKVKGALAAYGKAK